MHLLIDSLPTVARRDMCRTVQFAQPTRRNYIDKMSAGLIGSYAPSFISRITVPLSRALNVCHCPAGIFNAQTGPPAASSNEASSTPLRRIILLHHTATQHNHRLRSRLMSMHRHHRLRLNRVQHPLRPVLRRIPQIQIHPQPLRLLRLSGQLVKQYIINLHSILTTSSIVYEIVHFYTK